MLPSYPPRIQVLRTELIKAIPKAPNTKATKSHLNAFGTHHLVLTYLTWKMRFVPTKPRRVLIWSGGVDPYYFGTIRSRFQPLLGKVERGQDLTPHLSRLVHTLGFSMPRVPIEKHPSDRDGVLIKMGLHHFHVGAMNATNPHGRSGRLVFADVTDDEFKIIAISGHDALKIGATEWKQLFGISNRYIQSQLPSDVAYMAYPTMSSGHPMELVRYADHCDETMTRLDPSLEDRAFVDKLYSENDAADGHDLERPAKPTLKWHFENLDFGVLEVKTHVFFRMYFSPR